MDQPVTTQDELLPLLERTYAATAGVLEALSAGQLDAATPCDEWTLREVANHLVAGHDIFGRVAEGEVIDFGATGGGPEPDRLGADPGAAYRAVADRCLAAFGRPGAMEREAPFAFGPAPGFVVANISLSESLIHGWDLARGAGLPYAPDEAAVAAVAAFQSTGSEEDRRQPGMFGAERPAPPGASQFERLLAFLGRGV